MSLKGVMPIDSRIMSYNIADFVSYLIQSQCEWRNAMFDTVGMKVFPVPIDHNKWIALQAKSATWLDSQTGQLKTKYKLTDSLLPFIEYHDYSQTLVIERSIPKFLYGSNVTLLKASDIPLFFQTLHERLNILFNIQVSKEEWICERVDVSWNFQVGNQIGDYIKQLGTMSIPYKKTVVYGHSETVSFKNKSNEILFYDKAKECKRHKEPPSVIEQANGLLRLEIRSTYDDLKKYAPSAAKPLIC